ncbi:MAG: hypothetical protein EBY48_06095, partial [Opitutae bacterium]|nr:hypothetical protein [Opitutae bacterium]
GTSCKRFRTSTSAVFGSIFREQPSKEKTRQRAIKLEKWGFNEKGLNDLNRKKEESDQSCFRKQIKSKKSR